MANERYLTAKEAADALEVSVNTIYAYVSRGLIRSEASNMGKRQRRYYREDVDKLLARRDARHNPEQLAQDALHWGVPVLESTITLIDGGNLYYRGYPIDEVVRTMTVEQVASLIWTGDIAQADKLFDHDMQPSAQKYEMMLLHVEVDGADLLPIQMFQTLLPIIAADDPTAYDMTPERVAIKGAHVLHLLTSVAAGEVPEQLGIAGMLQRGWCPDDPKGEKLLSTALILCADHELNASSFAARVVASASAPPYAVINAGLSALQGTKHGGNTESVEAFLREVGQPERAKSVITARLRRGEIIPGFGHQLYPDGDPRGAILWEMMQAHYPDSPHVALGREVLKQAKALIQKEPTIDYALALLGQLFDLPEGSTLGLFALGRTIGWIGHAIEQYKADMLIRPRARYIGDQPR